MNIIEEIIILKLYSKQRINLNIDSESQIYTPNNTNTTHSTQLPWNLSRRVDFSMRLPTRFGLRSHIPIYRTIQGDHYALRLRGPLAFYPQRSKHVWIYIYIYICWPYHPPESWAHIIIIIIRVCYTIMARKDRKAKPATSDRMAHGGGTHISAWWWCPYTHTPSKVRVGQRRVTLLPK